MYTSLAAENLGSLENYIAPYLICMFWSSGCAAKQGSAFPFLWVGQWAMSYNSYNYTIIDTVFMVNPPQKFQSHLYWITLKYITKYLNV